MQRNAGSETRIILDTKPIIKLFAEQEGWTHVRRILQMAEGGEIKAGISVVTLSEVYYKYLQRWPEVAVARMEQLRYSPYLRKIEVDEEVAVRAGELKVRYALPLADAIIASSAYLNGAIVISDDPEFKKVEEIRVLNEIEFCKSRA